MKEESNNNTTRDISLEKLLNLRKSDIDYFTNQIHVRGNTKIVIEICTLLGLLLNMVDFKDQAKVDTIECVIAQLNLVNLWNQEALSTLLSAIQQQHRTEVLNVLMHNLPENIKVDFAHLFFKDIKSI